MADVSFNEESFEPQHPQASAPEKEGGIAGLFVKLGLAKDQKQTNTAMYVVIALCVIIMLLVWFV
jgi:hypothetical protein